MRLSFLPAAALPLALLLPVSLPAEHWLEPQVAAFEAADQADPPAPGKVLFIGSSSIRGWRSLAEDFPGLDTLNRGFGGSTIADCLHFADRLIIPHQPRFIVLYAGENDLAAGHTPDAVAAAFLRLLVHLEEHLGPTPLVFLSLKPSPARAHLIEAMCDANTRIAAICTSRDHLHFLDLFTPMLGDDGQPNPDLFIRDQLHLNRAGYDLWTRKLSAFFAANLP
ncbi:MAG: hypothetical protein EA425_14080 [Puniceicoccaceae bacterium]|nr:MAG: hypothetical protein EA425_14080 [Puniceicoccaceae bacterium]